MKLLWLLMVGLSLTGSLLGEENRKDGNHLLPGCRLADNEPHGSMEFFDAGYCVGVIHGVIRSSHRICTPEEVTVGQEIKVVLKYLQENPATLQLDGADLTEQALANAFPCLKK